MKTLIVSPLIVSLLGLSACNHSATPSDTNAASAPQAASATPVAYTPPTADQLYQMVAPIALFPDKLVALVLAGSTYPAQITAANTWVTQNPSLTGQALANAADAQPWDPSVKALTKFPAVLAQMASNLAWTTALGQAYYNDPTDVMNAIQVMRQRAQASGSLRSSGRLHVTQVAQAAPADYTPANDTPVIYTGPDIVPPPDQTIEIEPAQPDEVYVPAYNPATVYGEPVSSYPGYVYQQPAYESEAVPAGVIGFGVAVAVGAVIIGHHDWGWHSWGMNWGGPHRDGGPDRGDYRQRPAVVYNHTTYVSKSNTVINNVTNIRNTEITNNYNRNVTNNSTYGRNAPPQGSGPAHAPEMQNPGASPMSTPHFGANDIRPGMRPSPESFTQNHPGGPGQQQPGAMREEERQQQMQQRNEAQQQQQRQEMQQQNEARQQQQREEMQQQNDARQQQQRQEMQQQNDARQQQQRQEMQQQNEARQQQQRQEMQQQNEARQQQQRQEMQQQNEARQQQQRQAMQQQNEARQQQQRQEMQQQNEARQQQQRQAMQQQSEARQQQQQQHNEAQRQPQPAHAPQDPRDHHPQ